MSVLVIRISIQAVPKDVQRLAREKDVPNNKGGASLSM